MENFIGLSNRLINSNCIAKVEFSGVTRDTSRAIVYYNTGYFDGEKFVLYSEEFKNRDCEILQKKFEILT